MSRFRGYESRKLSSLILQIFNIRPHNLGHTPGLGNAAAGRVGGMAVEDLRNLADAGLGQMVLDSLHQF